MVWGLDSSKAEKQPESVLLMSGDIGGTNSRFVLFRVLLADMMMSDDPVDHPHFDVVYSTKFQNAMYNQFKDVMTEFFSAAEKSSSFSRTSDVLAACCMAVAGPVEDGHANFTNSGWVIDSHDIKEWFGFQEVTVVNDFVASGYGTLTLHESEVTVLQEGKRNLSAPIAVLGAGTGLGECFLAPTQKNGNSSYDAFPTEGGHVEFAPKTQIQFKCLQFLQEKFKGRVSVERIVSGKGLLNVYEFFKSEVPEEIEENHDHRIMSAVEAGKEIAQLAYDYRLCALTMDFVFEVYGTEAGSVALQYLPYGGLFIAGSLAPRNISRLAGSDSSFMTAVLDKGRVCPALKNIPIKVVMVEDLGMRGSQLLAYKVFSESQADSHPKPSSKLEFVDDMATKEKLVVPNVYYAQQRLDVMYVAQIATASSIAASIALIFGFGARELTKLSNR